MKKSIFLFIILLAAGLVNAEVSNITYKKLKKEVAGHNGKTVVIFWATYCPYCLKELTAVKNNYKYFTDNGVKIIGIAIDKSEETVRVFTEKNKFPFKTYLITDSLKEKMNIRMVPITAVFDKKGRMDDISPGCKTFQDLKTMLPG
ncbi:TlpA family protein disulfide reductase [Flexistipes sp.]|uniref:TlpA family protein disulfide reductase n=1 Tax=Flexistipes sp. TaxID=3088135 RepID=UPI002E1AE408|nr:TlpA disulfide reductase family protein [Flexistipes sp.]